MKHSEAARVTVKIANRERSILIKISDDGKGFEAKDQNSTEKREGFGLIGMTERVRILGGTLHIISAVGQGTTIKLEIWKHK